MADGTTARPAAPLRGVILLALAAAAIAIAWRHSPENPLFPFICPFHALTGLHCPGCGTMRGLNAVLHGRILEGIARNPLAAIAVPYLLLAVASESRQAFTGRRLPLPSLPDGLVATLPWVVIAYTVARNLPWEPFRALGP